MLDKRLLSDFEKHANSDYCNVLGALLPQKMIDEFIDRSGIPPHEKVHDITRAQRETIRTLLKRWTVNVSAPMPVENAIITSGGVKVGEIDPKTMASKKDRRPVLCRRDHRRRRLHGRLQSANRPGDRQGRGRGCRGRTADAVSTYLL